jgi:Tol biopolymer transport system component
MVALDRAGRVVQRIGKPGTFEDLSLSPDGREVVAFVASSNADISRMNLTTGELRRITFEPTTEDNPVYSPDGRFIAYRKAVAANDQRIYAQSIDGSGEPKLLHREAEQFVVPRAWAPDGKTLALWASPSRLMLVDTERKRIDTVSMRASREGGRFSPDGRWFAWASEETGESEVYVASFPGLRGRQQVSIRGGRFPQWSARSGELFFLAGDTLMVSRVTTGASFTHATPQPLFVTPPGAMSLTGFVVSGDGQRFYYAAPSPDASAHEIRVVLNLGGIVNAKSPR